MKAICDPQQAAAILLQTFEQILQEKMQGIPILNNNLQVQTLGFQQFEGRIMGIVITPWLMNLIILPNEEDDWSNLELGKKMSIKFPSISCKFMVNDIDGIGKCKTHSLYSPMHEFNSQDHVAKVAQDFLDDLTVAREPTAEELVDEDLLGKIMRGEDVDIDLDEFAVLEPIQQSVKMEQTSHQEKRVESSFAQAMSRRDLIRGKFLRE